jgi:hypothetical protein
MNRIAPAWLRPIGRVFPRVVIEHTNSAHAPVHATHVAAELGVSVVSLERAVVFGVTERRETVEAAEPERREEERREEERVDAAEPERHQEDRRNEVAEERIDGERSHTEPERRGEERLEEDRLNEGAEGRREAERREEDRREAVEAAADRRKEGAERDEKQRDEKQRKDYGDSEEDTFGILSVRSLSDVSDMSGVDDDFDHDANELSCFTTLGPLGNLEGSLGPVDCPIGPVEGGALSAAFGAIEKTGPTYEDQVRFIAQADAETMQRRHVTGEGVYYFPRFSSATEERRAQKAPRRACIELGETVFSFGTIMYDSEIELTFLGHRVARTRRGDFNARVERRGNALVVVAVDQILVFREIIVDATWMETMAL